eukprot:361656-Pyramimonas_sp.AAC.1
MPSRALARHDGDRPEEVERRTLQMIPGSSWTTLPKSSRAARCRPGSLRRRGASGARRRCHGTQATVFQQRRVQRPRDAPRPARRRPTNRRPLAWTAE